MVEGQILKAVDSAIEGGGPGVDSGNEHLLPPPSTDSGFQRFCVLWKAKQSRAVQIQND
jgi:hypothetical protein